MKGLDGVLVQSHSSLISFSSTGIYSASAAVILCELICFIRFIILLHSLTPFVSSLFEQNNAWNISRIVAGFTRRHFHVDRLLEQHFIGIFVLVWYSFLVCLIRNRWSHLESHQILFQWLENQRVGRQLFNRRPQHLHVGRLGHSWILRHQATGHGQQKQARQGNSSYCPEETAR